MRRETKNDSRKEKVVKKKKEGLKLGKEERRNEDEKCEKQK